MKSPVAPLGSTNDDWPWDAKLDVSADLRSRDLDLEVLSRSAPEAMPGCYLATTISILCLTLR